MTTTVFLIRHVPHAFQDIKSVGRMQDVPLAPDAHRWLDRLQRRMSRERLDAIYASPLLRAQRTAEAVAAPHGSAVRTDPDLVEIDTGEWTGRDFTETDDLPACRAWNTVRSLHRLPGGESMLEVQLRMVRALERVRGSHDGQHVAMVSHGDPLKALVLHLLGLGIDAYSRFELNCASVSAALVGDWGAKLLTLNDTSHLADLNGAPIA